MRATLNVVVGLCSLYHSPILWRENISDTGLRPAGTGVRFVGIRPIAVVITQFFPFPDIPCRDNPNRA